MNFSLLCVASIIDANSFMPLALLLNISCDSYEIVF